MTTPTRLTAAMQSVCSECSGAQLAHILGIPKRTADRWLAELRDGNLDNWHGGAVERLASHEMATWGTTRIAESLQPVSADLHVATHERADVHRVAMVMRAIITSHQVNSELLGEMAQDLSDGVLSLDEVQALVPLVARSQVAVAEKQRALAKLQVMLENRLR